MTGLNRDIRRQGDPGSDPEDVERELRRLAPAAAPVGLRERVLDGAAAARRGAWLAPWMRVAAAACSISIAALLVLDPLMTHHEEARLSAVLDGRSLTSAPPETGAELAEAGLDAGTAAQQWVRIQNLAAAVARREVIREPLEARERLKGWLEYETSEDPD